MPLPTIGFKARPELIQAIEEYAAEHTAGNRSAAITSLIEAGLHNVHIDDYLAGVIKRAADEAMERVEARVARAASRESKASLASLILCSTYLPAIADEVMESAKLSARLHGRDIDDCLYGIDEAAAYISDMSFAHPSEVFDFAWNAGGRAQGQRGRVSYGNAVKGSKAAGGRR